MLQNGNVRLNLIEISPRGSETSFELLAMSRVDWRYLRGGGDAQFCFYPTESQMGRRWAERGISVVFYSDLCVLWA